MTCLELDKKEIAKDILNDRAVLELIELHIDLLEQRQFQSVYDDYLTSGQRANVTYCLTYSDIDILPHLIDIPDSFASTIELVKAYIPNNIQRIGKWAFADSSLMYIEFDSNSKCTILEHSAFSNTWLEEFTVPASVLHIDSDCFSGCAALTKFTLGPNVQSISSAVFANCNQLKEIHFVGTMKEFDYLDSQSDKNWWRWSSVETVKCLDGEVVI